MILKKEKKEQRSKSKQLNYKNVSRWNVSIISRRKLNGTKN